MAAPRQLIDNPAVFTPLSYSLLSVAQQPTAADHWQNGITYQTNCLNDGGTTYDECIAVTGSGAPPPPASKAANTDLDLRGATPFTVFTEFECSPVGVEDALQIARDALNQNAPWQVERAFWTGVAGSQEVVFPHLADNAQVVDANGILLQSVPVTGAVSPITIGLGFLERELGNCYNGEGVIHVSRKVLPILMAWNLVETRGAQLRTKNGNLVVVGSGYPGTGPAGQTPSFGNEWIFATGAVFAYRGPVRIPNFTESFNRAENTVQAIAEQTYLVGWDCCHAAIEINLGVPII